MRRLAIALQRRSSRCGARRNFIQTPQIHQSSAALGVRKSHTRRRLCCRRRGSRKLNSRNPERRRLLGNGLASGVEFPTPRASVRCSGPHASTGRGWKQHVRVLVKSMLRFTPHGGRHARRLVFFFPKFIKQRSCPGRGGLLFCQAVQSPPEKRGCQVYKLLGRQSLRAKRCVQLRHFDSWWENGLHPNKQSGGAGSFLENTPLLKCV